MPRRETSKRKAKEKGSILLGDDDDPDEFSNSDSDPAWTPVNSKPKAHNANVSF